MQDCSDEELLAKLHAAEDSSHRAAVLDELFGRYHSRVATWCYRFSGSRELAADLAQDVFLKAYRSLGSFRGGSRFSTWIYVIAKNHCVNESKARAAKPEGATDNLELDVEDGNAASVLSELEKRERLQLVQSLMNENLDETERRVMTMHFADEMPLESVTRLLGLTNASGAKAHIVSAKRKLNAAIQRWHARQPGRA